MCEFCTQHGEGEIWYLRLENYLEERLATEEQRQFPNTLYENLENWAAHSWAAVNAVDDPGELVRVGFEEMKKEHWGQILPLEDVEKIFDLSLNMVRIPCPCRLALHGVKEHRSCYHVVATPSNFWKDMFDQWPDVSGELDVVTVEEAKADFLKFDEQGLIHSVWSFGSPFLGAICNCTPMDCLSMRGLFYGGQRPFFKAEYVATIDAEKCIGCRDCMSFCHFGAISYSSSSEKCMVRQMACFGCGLCRAACPNDAITLFDRNAIPQLVNEW